jgi:RimJ/RimL family protein N-acetyltransferase
MNINLQPLLQSGEVILYPLQENDLEALYAVAADPKIWEQHPNKDRWQKDVFITFFQGALQSKSAFRIVDKTTGEVAGSTRFYDYDPEAGCLLIGYTFYARRYWGKGINHSVKAMMLDYAFQFVSTVRFQIGSENVRSQLAISRLGAKKIDEQQVAYFGETPKLNFIYEIKKVDWTNLHPAS